MNPNPIVLVYILFWVPSVSTSFAMILHNLVSVIGELFLEFSVFGGGFVDFSSAHLSVIR